MGWPITAADVRAELSFPAFTPGEPEETDPLEVYAQAACSRIEREIGPRAGQTITLRDRGPARTLVFEHPIEQLDSVTVGGSSLDVTDLDVDASAGLVHGTFAEGLIVAVATAPDGVPTEVELAARYLAATWYRQTQVGPPRARSQADDPDGDVLQGFAMPRRVSEMIRPYALEWGFA